MSSYSKEVRQILNLNNDEVYYGKEANWQYMSVSQYKEFVKCEAAALAKLKGDYEPLNNPKALLVGNFVHSYFESPEAHTIFIEQNKDEMYSKRKPHGLLKDFKVAQAMIERVEREPFFNFLWKGEKEVVVTGELFSTEWKGKIDLLNIEEGYFVDLKTTRSIDNRMWSTDYGQYVSFIEGYGYVTQLAIYEKLLEMEYGKPFEGFIYAVSKEEPPNVQAIEVDWHKKMFEYDLVEQRMEGILKVKHGEAKPEMCGNCEYCRQHKELNGFVGSDQLI